MDSAAASISPKSELEFSEAIAASTVGRLLVVAGSSSPSYAPRSSRPTQVISTSRFSGITRRVNADFYVTCRAGTRLSELAAELSQHSLSFPFLTEGASGTVGGMVARGQLTRGTDCFNISRWVLALKVAMADGKIIKTGAITYKSVAGYDLPKLFCGSFGTLGLILEVSLRLYPVGAQPYGKDLLPAKPRIPILTGPEDVGAAASPEAEISQRIKREFDPNGKFPAISGWNSR